MKISISCFLFAVLWSSSVAQKLTVVVTNIKNDNGQIGAALYASKDSFMNTTFMTQGTPAIEGSVTLVFEKVPKGEYGISILHDENNNTKMDSNSVGIPKEGFGFSNDAMGTFGPPGWNKVKFDSTGKDQVVTIKLRYM